MKRTILFALVIAGFLASCNKGAAPCIDGNGNSVTKTLDLASFTKVDLRGSMNVEVNEGTTQSVRVIGDENIMDYLNFTVSGGWCSLELKDGCYGDFNLLVEITSPNLNEIRINGSGNIDINNINSLANSLVLDINGSGNIGLDGLSSNVSELDLSISGSGNIEALSEFDIESESVNLSGSGNLKLFNVIGQDCDVILSGSGNIEVNAQNELVVDLSGSGNVYYKGLPISIQSDISGSGSVIDAN